MNIARGLVAAALAVAAGSCTEPSVPVAEVRLEPALDTLPPGGTMQLVGVALDAAGNELVGRRISWLSSHPEVARVSDEGVVTALAEGEATVAAIVERASAEHAVTVRARVAGVTITAAADSLPAGGTMQLAAAPSDSTGRSLSGTGYLPRTVSWRSLDPGRAVVSSQGLVRGVAPGTAAVEAFIEGVADTLALRVLVPVASVVLNVAADTIEPADTLVLVADVRDSTGATIAGRTVSWASSNVGVAQISSAGLVIASYEGTAAVIAAAEGRADTARVTVRFVVATVEVASPVDTLGARSTLQVATVVRDPRGRTVPNRLARWSSSDPAVAQVSDGGDGAALVHGLKSGPVTITAAIDSASGSLALRVLSFVDSVVITPRQAVVQRGATLQLAASVFAEFGQQVTDRPVSWQSASPFNATVSGAGLVTGVMPGRTAIQAIAGGRTGAGEVAVSAGTPANIAGEWSLSFDTYDWWNDMSCSDSGSTGFALDGGVVTGRLFTGGACQLPAAAPLAGILVDSALSLASGVCRLEATANSVAQPDTISGGIVCESEYAYVEGSWIAVRSGAPASLAITRSGQLVRIGVPVRFGTILLDAQGHRIYGRPVVWTSSAPDVATVSDSGDVRGLRFGTAVIRAASAGLEATQSISVAVEVLPYGADGFRFKVVDHDQPVTGFEQESFDDVAAQFALGTTAFGTGAYCPLDDDIRTTWPTDTDLLVRRAFVVPAGARSVEVAIAIDDAVQVFVNGTDVTALAGTERLAGGFQNHSYCAERDSFVFRIPASIFREGSNLLAVRARDYGGLNFLDVAISAGP